MIDVEKQIEEVMGFVLDCLEARADWLDSGCTSESDKSRYDKAWEAIRAKLRTMLSSAQSEEQEPKWFMRMSKDGQAICHLEPFVAERERAEIEMTGGSLLPVYTHPATARGVDAQDAARWRMAKLIYRETMFHPDKRTATEAVAAYMHAVHSGLDIQGAIDAALAVQAKQGGAEHG